MTDCLKQLFQSYIVVIFIEMRNLDRLERKDCHLEQWAIKQTIFSLLSFSPTLSEVPRSYNIHPWRFT